MVSAPAHETWFGPFAKVGEALMVWTWGCACAPGLRGGTHGSDTAASGAAVLHLEDPATTRPWRVLEVRV